MPASQPRSSRKAVIEWIVFGALMALGLSFFFGLIVPIVHGHWRTRSKTMVPATLKTVETAVVRRSGRDATETIARYEYEFAGRTYQGREVSLWAYTGRFHRELKSALDQGSKIRVYVDPTDPSYSVYDRKFTPWPFAGMVFAALMTSGMGAYGLLWCWKNRRGGIGA